MIDSKTYFTEIFKRANELHPNDIAARNVFCLLASGRVSEMQRRSAIKTVIRMQESYDEFRERVKQAFSEDKET